MRGFVVGTVITAIAFVILTKFLPQFVSYDGDLIGLAIVSIIFGVVNGLIGPIVRLLALPLRMMTLGLIGFVINAGLLLLTAWIATAMHFDLTVGDYPPDPSEHRHARRRHRRCRRPEPRQHRRPACHPRLRRVPDRSGSAKSAFPRSPTRSGELARPTARPST